MSTPDRDPVTAATEAVYRAWLPYIGDIEARAQAQAFARRFQITEGAAHAAA